MATREQLDVMRLIAAVLIWSFLFAMALTLAWFIFFIVARDWAFALHSKWFDLTPRDFDLMCYYSMALMKIIGIVFFLFPYLAIRLVVWKAK